MGGRYYLGFYQNSYTYESSTKILTLLTRGESCEYYSYPTPRSTYLTMECSYYTDTYISSVSEPSTNRQPAIML